MIKLLGLLSLLGISAVFGYGACQMMNCEVPHKPEAKPTAPAARTTPSPDLLPEPSQKAVSKEAIILASILIGSSLDTEHSYESFAELCRAARGGLRGAEACAALDPPVNYTK
jgi:hypothetical protein